MMSHLRGSIPLVCLSLALCVTAGTRARAGAPQTVGSAQRTNPSQPPSVLPSAGSTVDPGDPFRAGMEARRLKMQNDDRHKRLVSDTEKLLSLSTELKEDVSKTTKNELSLDVIKKAAEIEKLAHDVKERMRS